MFYSLSIYWNIVLNLFEVKIALNKVLMTNEMHNSYNQFLFHSFMFALHVSKETSRSSAAALYNIPCNTVHYAVLLVMNG